MNILAVDDEPLMLWQLTENLKHIFEKPEYQVSGFDGYQAAWDVRN